MTGVGENWDVAIRNSCHAEPRTPKHDYKAASKSILRTPPSSQSAEQFITAKHLDVEGNGIAAGSIQTSALKAKGRFIKAFWLKRALKSNQELSAFSVVLKCRCLGLACLCGCKSSILCLCSCCFFSVLFWPPSDVVGEQRMCQMVCKSFKWLSGLKCPDQSRMDCLNSGPDDLKWLSGLQLAAKIQFSHNA